MRKSILLLLTSLITVSGFAEAADYQINVTTVPVAVYPENYGAKGDGTTDDSDALIAALATGKPMELTFGKTYVCSKPLYPVTGQIIYGNNAVLKRAAQLATTTTTTITSGVTTSITVADAAGFRAGQLISIASGTYYDASNRVISSINGHIVNTTTAFGLSSSGTTSVYLSYDLIETTNGAKIIDLEIDGNGGSYTFYHWQNTSEVKAIGPNNIIKGCYFHNSPGEGIQESALTPWNGLPTSTGNEYSGNRFITLNGNGIHLSASDGTIIDKNKFDGTNLQGSTMGHDGGNVTYSAQVRHAKITSNIMYNGRTCLGQIASWSARDLLFSGNTCSIHPTLGYAAFEGNAGSLNSPFKGITITNNVFSNASTTKGVYLKANYTKTTPAAPTGNVLANSSVISNLSTMANIANGMNISGTGIPANSLIVANDGVSTITIGDLYGNPVPATATNNGVTLTISGRYPWDIVVTGNRFINTEITYQSVDGVTHSGNYHEMSPAEQTYPAISIGALTSNATFADNTVKYGNAAFSFGGSGNVNVSVTNNQMLYQYYYGLYEAGTNYAGISIKNNTIVNDATANAGNYQGISITSPGDIIGNTCRLATGYTCYRNYGTSGVWLNNIAQNAAYNGTSKFSFRVETGSTNYVLGGNMANGAFTDAVSSPTASFDNNLIP